VVRALLHGGCEHGKILEYALELVEKMIPISTMLQEPAKALEGSVEAELSQDLDQYVEMLVHAEQFLIRAGRAPREARKIVLLAEPFVRFREELERRLDCQPAGDGEGGPR
jgi:hypothetical protein